MLRVEGGGSNNYLVMHLYQHPSHVSVLAFPVSDSTWPPEMTGSGISYRHSLLPPPPSYPPNKTRLSPILKYVWASLKNDYYLKEIAKKHEVNHSSVYWNDPNVK